MFFIILGWAVFACDDMKVLSTYIETMFGVDTVAGNSISLYYWSSYGLLLVVLLLGSLELPRRLGEKLCECIRRQLGGAAPARGERIVFLLRLVWLAVLLTASTALLVSGSYNPFLYFRF